MFSTRQQKMNEWVLTLLNLSLLEFPGHFCTVWPLKDKTKLSAKHCATYCQISYSLSMFQM